MLRIMVLEDDPLVAQTMQHWLAALDCEMVGPADSIATALQLIEAREMDAAMIDLWICGQPSFPVTDLLKAKRIPFAVTTGQIGPAVDQRFEDAPILPKPFRFGDLTRLVNSFNAPPQGV